MVVVVVTPPARQRTAAAEEGEEGCGLAGEEEVLVSQLGWTGKKRKSQKLPEDELGRKRRRVKSLGTADGTAGPTINPHQSRKWSTLSRAGKG